MPKLVAILNVIAWAGFWAFGYLALSADVTDGGQIMAAFGLAAAGAGVGLFCWMYLVRHSEATGYAKRSRRVSQKLEEGMA